MSETHTKKGPKIDLAIEGGHSLRGAVETHTSKNGAVALLCASLLNKGTTTLKRVPRIEEVFRHIEILESIGCEIDFTDDVIRVTPPQKIEIEKMDKEAACLTRSVIMYLGTLVHHAQNFTIPQSGGCDLGKRIVQPHFFALEPFGISVSVKNGSYHVTHTKLTPAEIVLYESGDTVTENALIAAALIPGTTTIKYATANYMVQELCFFLEKCGIKIEGVGTTTLTITGISDINTDIEYTLSEDPTDAMFFIAAAIVTKSEITITRVPIEFLELELLKLEKMGFRYTKSEPYLSYNKRTKLVDITTKPSVLVALPEKIHPLPYPGLNIDNLPFFVIITTQAKGETFIHDWVYDGRAVHYAELEQLGAKIHLADQHRVFIVGPTTFKPAHLTCPHALRPAAILLIAMLGAKGSSELKDIYIIKRGYHNIAERLQALGASVSVSKTE